MILSSFIGQDNKPKEVLCQAKFGGRSAPIYMRCHWFAVLVLAPKFPLLETKNAAFLI